MLRTVRQWLSDQFLGLAIICSPGPKQKSPASQYNSFIAMTPTKCAVNQMAEHVVLMRHGLMDMDVKDLAMDDLSQAVAGNTLGYVVERMNIAVAELYTAIQQLREQSTKPRETNVGHGRIQVGSPIRYPLREPAVDHMANAMMELMEAFYVSGDMPWEAIVRILDEKWSKENA